MKKIFLLLVFSFVGISIYAQSDISLQKQFGVKANLVAPGFGAFYELPVSQKVLSDFTLGFGMPILKAWGSVEIDDSRIKPYTRIGVRYYYNRAKRLRKGKEIEYNRGNFLGIQNKIMYGPISNDLTTIFLNEVYWGVQTEIAKNLVLVFHIGGAHYYTRYKEHYYSPLLDFKIKYILF